MQNILLAINASPYGSERVLTALRLTLALAGHEHKPVIRIFLLSDAVVTAVKDQKTAQSPSLGEMVAEAMAHGVEIYVCRTCADARGLTESALLPGIRIGSNCVVGAGSVVNCDIPDEMVAYGVPAKVIRRHL